MGATVAILATVATLIATAGLARRKPAFYDPEVTNGMIFVGVEHPREGSMPDVERALLSTPGVPCSGHWSIVRTTAEWGSADSPHSPSSRQKGSG